MNTAFVIRNHHGYFLTRQQEWVSSHDTGAMYVATYKDLAVNTLVEVNAKDIELRCQVMAVALDDKGRPLLPKDQQDIALDAPGIEPQSAAGEASVNTESA